MIKGVSELLTSCEGGRVGEGPALSFSSAGSRPRAIRGGVVADSEAFGDWGALKAERHRIHVFNRAIPRVKHEFECLYRGIRDAVANG